MSLYIHTNSFQHGHGCCSITRRDYQINIEDFVFYIDEEELGKSNKCLCRKCSVWSLDIPVVSIIQHRLERVWTLMIATANWVTGD